MRARARARLVAREKPGPQSWITSTVYKQNHRLREPGGSSGDPAGKCVGLLRVSPRLVFSPWGVRMRSTPPPLDAMPSPRFMQGTRGGRGWWLELYCHFHGWIERIPGGTGKLTVWKLGLWGAAAARLAWMYSLRLTRDCRPVVVCCSGCEVDKAGGLSPDCPVDFRIREGPPHTLSAQLNVGVY